MKVGGVGGEGTKAASAIVGRYFWRSELVLQTSYLHGYCFVDEHWVYPGMLEHGVPSCTSQTATGEEDGCLAYTWDEKTGALNIAGTTGEFNPATRTFKVDETAYSEGVPAAAGTKVDASGEYINGFGICPLSCSFTTVELEMSSTGEFAKAAAVVGFFGEGGSYGALPRKTTAPTRSPRGATSPSTTPTTTPNRRASPSCSTTPTTPISTTGSC